MVKSRAIHLALAVLFILMMLAGTVSAAWSGTYYLDHEWVKIWINQNGTIDLFYNVTVTLDSGDNINRVYLGQPKADFTVGQAHDQYGRNLTVRDVSSGGEYRVEVNLYQPLTAGHTLWFTLTTNVAHMISEETQNKSRVGMLFIPTWFDVNVNDVRVSIVLPAGMDISMVGASKNWSSTGSEDDGRLWVYWETQNLMPNEQSPVGISFPKEYVQNYDKPSESNWWSSILPFAIAGIFILIVVAFFIFAASKKSYVAPRMSVETLGVRRGLTAVEASYLLDLKPARLVTEILYSLLQKRAIWVESTNPSIKLKVMESFQNKVGTNDMPLRYYEIDFLNSLKPDGTLDEVKLARAVMNLRENVEGRMRGYCRRDTVDYYRKVVAKAWGQVEQAGTPDLASKAYDEQLLWLLLDPECQARTQTTFRDRAFEPNPLWFWYWYGYTHYYPHPAYAPAPQPPPQTAKLPSLPGADFANNIVKTLEGTSNSIVVNLEKFANAIVPLPQAQKVSSQPVHHDATCVCACHACACACACVSCACACAGGGVG